MEGLKSHIMWKDGQLRNKEHQESGRYLWGVKVFLSEDHGVPEGLKKVRY